MHKTSAPHWMVLIMLPNIAIHINLKLRECHADLYSSPKTNQ